MELQYKSCCSIFFMAKRKNYLFLLAILFANSILLGSECSDRFLHRFGHYVVDFNRYCFTKESLVCVGVTVPYYLVTRQFDQHINNSFFCWDHHCNCNQLPHWFHNCADYGLGFVLGLGMIAFCPCHKDLRRAAEIYLTAIPFTWVGKNALKSIKHDGCLRPKHGKFDWRKKWYGGCPSGHMMEIAFATVYWGLVGGPVFAVPISIFGATMAADFVVGNRHYVSQLVAGAGLGVIYALAAYRTYQDEQKRLCDFDIDPICTDSGEVGVRCSMSF